MKTAVSILFFMVILGCSAQVKHPNSVIGSGGDMMSTPTHVLRGTVSQSAIGYLPHSQISHGIGFWYQASLLTKFRDNGSYILIPNIAANSGEYVTIPILLESSKNLFQSGARTFEAKIRFNKSLLEPLQPTEYEEVGAYYILTVRGEAKDTAGILATMRFRARLGNDSVTPLSFDSFRWVETSALKVATQNGEFTLNDLCKAGGVTRLIKTGTSALTLAPVQPNPVRTTATISFTLREKATVRLSIVDVKGREMTILKNEDLNQGKYDANYDVSLMASGTYFIVLRTDSDVLFQPLQISK